MRRSCVWLSSTVAVTVFRVSVGGFSPTAAPGGTIRVLSPREGEVVPAGRPDPRVAELKGAVLVSTKVQSFPTPPPPNAGHIHILVDGRLRSVQPTGGPGDTFRGSPFRGCRVCRSVPSIVFSPASHGDCRSPPLGVPLSQRPCSNPFSEAAS